MIDIGRHSIVSAAVGDVRDPGDGQAAHKKLLIGFRRGGVVACDGLWSAGQRCVTSDRRAHSPLAAPPPKGARQRTVLNMLV